MDKHESGSQQSRDCPVGACARWAIASGGGGNLKVVEVPPGPPVWSPIVAEVYGPTQAAREAARAGLQARFVAATDLVDVDIYLTDPQPKWRLVVDRASKPPCSGRSRGPGGTLNGRVGLSGCQLAAGARRQYPVPIRIRLAPGDKAGSGGLALKVRSQSGSQLVRVSPAGECAAMRWLPAISCTRTCSPW